MASGRGSVPIGETATARSRPEPRHSTCARRPAGPGSYRRAEEIFEGNIRLPANPFASPDDIEGTGG
ncbi:hypothetical protein ACIP39_02165 [Streptomyces tibetensis]|uniref:hypothetical protein n=1 Tax=Streptomyces tibetensis TaxID=2382123 RepID=UPI0038088E7F